MQKRCLFAAAGFVLIEVVVAGMAADAVEYRGDHVRVAYDKIPEAYATAIGKVVESARQICIDQYAFDMPDEITVTVQVDSKAQPRLFNDGADRFSLAVRGERDLKKPATSGIFHLYGLCHEVGHLGMYRPIADHSWLSTAAAEGWAHYLGSQLVDEVYKRDGAKLWPDGYDYRADGMARLTKQLTAARPSEIAQGAKFWQEFIEIVGKEGAAPIFAAWGDAEIPPTDPGPAILAAMLKANSDGRLRTWWERAEPSFVVQREKSEFVARTVKKSELTGSPHELASDDGKAVGKRSIAGGGHAVRFEASGESPFLTRVRIHGARYGTPQAPKDQFQIWLCDADFHVIKELKFPYSKFKRGEPDLDFLQEPFGHHAEELFCFNSLVPASSPGVAPSSKSCRLGQGILRPTLQLLAAVGRLAVQTVIDEPLAGRLFSAQSGWRITSDTPRAASTGISSEAS